MEEDMDVVWEAAMAVGIQDSVLGMDAEWEEDVITVEALVVPCAVSEAMDHAVEDMEDVVEDMEAMEAMEDMEGLVAIHQVVVTAVEVQTTVTPHITDKIVIRIIDKLA